MKIDSAATPFVLIALVPGVLAFAFGSALTGTLLLALPVAIALFFRDPERRPPSELRVVLSPADGRITHAGAARAGEAPAGEWKQVTIFLSVLDVHINRSPVAGRVTRVDYVPGSFRAAFHAEAYRNEHSEIWIDADGTRIVVRQVVGVLARRVVCRVAEGDRLERGGRIGLMKFGSRMDVFLPMSAEITTRVGDQVRAGETIVARLPGGSGTS